MFRRDEKRGSNVRSKANPIHADADDVQNGSDDDDADRFDGDLRQRIARW